METKRDDGGQAFPMIDVQIDGQAIGSAGMSLRDWFAGQAVTGFTGRYSEPNKWYLEQSAKDAYAMADAMLKARAE